MILLKQQERSGFEKHRKEEDGKYLHQYNDVLRTKNKIAFNINNLKIRFSKQIVIPLSWHTQVQSEKIHTFYLVHRLYVIVVPKKIIFMN